MLPIPDLLHSYVSRETYDKLLCYMRELELWNQSLNLVASSTVPHLWERHVVDSLQIVPMLNQASSVVDFGSGGGFPAIIVALASHASVTMMESDRRKCEFLMHCVRTLNLKNAQVLCARIDEIQSVDADVAISRACASVEMLCGFMMRHVRPEGAGFFLKGKRVLEEITVASSYKYDYTLHRSITDDGGVVLEIQHLRKAT